MSAQRFFLPADYQDNSPQRYDSSNPYWTRDRIRNARFYQAGVYAYAMRMARKYSAKQMIDVGCGVGSKLVRIHQECPDVKITGFDQEEGIAYCRSQYPFGSWEVIDLEEPDLERAKPGDVVLCADVIEHLENPDALLGFLRMCIRAGGRLVLSTPDRVAARGRKNRCSPNPAHIREWSRTELRCYLEHHGFRIVNQRRIMTVPMAAGRLFVDEVLRPIARGRSLSANQVCECVL